MNTQPAILFVCLGNICRSPLAEGAMRASAMLYDLDVFTDSAGTAAYHIGKQPDPRSIAVAQANGVNISGQRARQVCIEDFGRFDAIYAMDDENLSNLTALAPDGLAHKAQLLLDLDQTHSGQSVPDPYYGDHADFEHVWNLVSQATDCLARRLLKTGRI